MTNPAARPRAAEGADDARISDELGRSVTPERVQALLDHFMFRSDTEAWEVGLVVKALSQGLQSAEQERDQARRDLAAAAVEHELLRRALERCMVGGNHIASALIGAIGPGFPEEIASSDQALDVLWGKRADTDDLVYETWMCWKAIMEARDIAGGPDWNDAYRQARGPAARGAGTEGER